MKKNILFPKILPAMICVAALLATEACAKKVAAVAPKPPEAPAAAPAPAPAPEPVRARPVETAAAPAPTPAPKPNVLPEKERIRLNEALSKLEDALFDYDKATIRTDASVALKDNVAVIREILTDYPFQKLTIEGHADERGSDEYNLALGDKRALAAKEFLAGMGVPNAQLTTISFGKNRPVCTDDSEACHQRNRRAHITAAP